MARADQQDPVTGEIIPNPDPTPDPIEATYPAPPLPGEPTDANQDAAKRAFIASEYQRIMGVAPAESDLADALDRYNRFGGDALRTWLTERASGGGATESQGGGFTWGNLGAMSSDFGAPPDPFGESYTAGQYQPETFQEPFTAPTAESLNQDPGYQARMRSMQQGAERSAAARGSILSGGFVGKTLPRQLGEFASNEYANAFGRAFDTYRQRYGQFSDQQARGADAFKTNELGKLNQFQTRYNSYQDLVKNRRESERDKWDREYGLARLGLDATNSGAPR